MSTSAVLAPEVRTEASPRTRHPRGTPSTMPPSDRRRSSPNSSRSLRSQTSKERSPEKPAVAVEGEEGEDEIDPLDEEEEEEPVPPPQRLKLVFSRKRKPEDEADEGDLVKSVTATAAPSEAAEVEAAVLESAQEDEPMEGVEVEEAVETVEEAAVVDEIGGDQGDDAGETGDGDGDEGDGGEVEAGIEAPTVFAPDKPKRAPRKRRKWFRKGEIDPDDVVAVARQRERFARIDEAIESLDKQEKMILDETHPQLLELWAELESRYLKRGHNLEVRFQADIKQLERCRDADKEQVHTQFHHDKGELANRMVADNIRRMSHLNAEKNFLDRGRPSTKRQYTNMTTLRQGRGGYSWELNDHNLLSKNEEKFLPVVTESDIRRRRDISLHPRLASANEADSDLLRMGRRRLSPPPNPAIELLSKQTRPVQSAPPSRNKTASYPPSPAPIAPAAPAPTPAAPPLEKKPSKQQLQPQIKPASQAMAQSSSGSRSHPASAGLGRLIEPQPAPPPAQSTTQQTSVTQPFRRSLYETYLYGPPRQAPVKEQPKDKVEPATARVEHRSEPEWSWKPHTRPKSPVSNPRQIASAPAPAASTGAQSQSRPQSTTSTSAPAPRRPEPARDSARDVSRSDSSRFGLMGYGIGDFGHGLSSMYGRPAPVKEEKDADKPKPADKPADKPNQHWPYRIPPEERKDKPETTSRTSAWALDAQERRRAEERFVAGEKSREQMLKPARPSTQNGGSSTTNGASFNRTSDYVPSGYGIGAYGLGLRPFRPSPAEVPKAALTTSDAAKKLDPLAQREVEKEKERERAKEQEKEARLRDAIRAQRAEMIEMQMERDRVGAAGSGTGLTGRTEQAVQDERRFKPLWLKPM